MADSSFAIDVRGVTCAYGATVVLRDVSVAVPVGGFVGLIGPSGAGKTTLLRAMLGTVNRPHGAVTVWGRPVSEDRPPVGIGYVPQVATVDWHFPVTVEQVVLMGMAGRTGRWPWPTKTERHTAGAMLDRLGIGTLAKRQIRELSGGQQQRTFLARALVGAPRLLLLDEPTASVDVKTRDDILHLLAELHREGVTILMTTHELNTVAAHLPRVVCINGAVIAQGAPSEVFTGPILSRTFGTTMRVVRDPETGALLVAEAGTHGPLGGMNRQPSAVSYQPSASGSP